MLAKQWTQVSWGFYLIPFVFKSFHRHWNATLTMRFIVYVKWIACDATMWWRYVRSFKITTCNRFSHLLLVFSSSPPWHTYKLPSYNSIWSHRVFYFGNESIVKAWKFINVIEFSSTVKWTDCIKPWRINHGPQ